MRTKNIILALIINIFFAFTLVVFGPYEIFISNINEFNFTFQDFWWMTAGAAILYTVVSTLILMLLPQFISDIFCILIFASTLCCYIQTMFLNGEMRVLVGKDIEWSSGTIIFNMVIWGCIFIAIFLIRHFLKSSWKACIQFLSAILILIQMSALIFLLFTTNVLSEEKNGYISQDGMLELSQNENVIVFILDFFDGRTMESILTEEPEFLEPLTGFVYFPNATSVHSRTYPSVSYLLSGNMCHFDKTPKTYVNEAFDDSSFLQDLYNNKFDIGLYTSDYYIGNSARGCMRNYAPVHPSLKISNTIMYMTQIALYRGMPYLLKPFFTYEISEINNNLMVVNNAQDDSFMPEFRLYDDEWFYGNVINSGINLSDAAGAFRFYHLASCHLDLSNPALYGKRSLEIVYTYLDKMRELGIYGNSTIIITTDHGHSGGGETLDLPQKTAVPLMIAKPSGASAEKLKVSYAPVSHTDFIPTVLDGFSMDYDDYGNTLFEIQENTNRERYYYYSALYSDEEGEVELREYKVSGDARDNANYYFTGNAWKILYSQNKVALN